MKQTIRKIALTAAAVSLALGHSNLMAQESNNDDSVERIAVTGSLIKRIDMEGPSPLTSIDAAQIENTGVTDLIGLFAKLPISGQGTFSTQGNSSDDTANGGSSVSLRGLGADSTLILINGRRVSVSPFAKGIHAVKTASCDGYVCLVQIKKPTQYRRFWKFNKALLTKAYSIIHRMSLMLYHRRDQSN